MLTKYLCIILLSFQILAQEDSLSTPVENPANIEKEKVIEEKSNELKQEKSEEKKENNSPKAIAKIIRGEVYFIAKAMDGQQAESEIKETSLSTGDEVNIGSTITTKDKSFAQITLPDETILNIGPNSQMAIESFELSEHRKVSITHLNGQVRAIINRKNKDDNDSWKLNTKTVSVGARGTEFLSNAYVVEAKGTTDVALLKGEILANISDVNSSLKEVSLKPGQFFNSNDLIANGQDAIKTLSSDALDALKKNAEHFLPNLQDVKGGFINLNDVLSTQLGIVSATGIIGGAATMAAAFIPSSSDDNKEEKEDVVVAKEEKNKEQEIPKSRVVIKTSKHKELKDQPWDIRDALMNAQEKRVDNICYFWFYKSIPGSGDLERFRRERQCEDFEQ